MHITQLGPQNKMSLQATINRLSGLKDIKHESDAHYKLHN